MYLYIGSVQALLSWVCSVFVSPPVESQGILGNWKSRWPCMSFQEEAVTKEIETGHTGYHVNITRLRLCTFLILLLFPFSSHFPDGSSSPGLSPLPPHFMFHSRGETGNHVLLAEELSGRVHGGQSTKYVQKEQPVIMSNNRRPRTQRMNVSCYLWGTSSITERDGS